jgi:hypothetical protein
MGEGFVDAEGDEGEEDEKGEEGEEGDEGDEGDEWGRYRVVGFHAAFLTEAPKTAPPAKVHPTHC